MNHQKTAEEISLGGIMYSMVTIVNRIVEHTRKLPRQWTLKELCMVADGN